MENNTKNFRGKYSNGDYLHDVHPVFSNDRDITILFINLGIRVVSNPELR